MPSFLRSLYSTVFVVPFVVTHTVLSIALLFFLALLRCFPVKRWANFCTKVMNRVPLHWSRINRFILENITRIKLESKGLDGLSEHAWYMIISNHSSWADIIILQSVFAGNVPVMKFFLKQKLLWLLPVVSWGAWLLDFPFISRYSKKFLAKHPAYKQKEAARIKKCCECFKKSPTSLINFVEGTRFTLKKHEKQQSPYKHLLRPKAGGLGFALNILGQQFNALLDTTIIYPKKTDSFWKLILGKVPKVIVQVNKIPMTPDLLGDYEHDRQFRVYLQSWLNERWLEKDNLIESYQVHAL